MDGGDDPTVRSPPDEQLERARAAYREYRWDVAYEGFQEVARESGLDAGDLAALADAAWWLGRTDESLSLSEEVYRHHLHGSHVPQAARLAVEIGFLWLLRGEAMLASGWISRAGRLLEGAPESAAHGYLAFLQVEEHLGAGRYADAIETSRWMQSLADRHHDPTLCAVGLVLEGIAEIRAGRVDHGLRVIDEAMLPVRAGEVSPNWAGNLYCHVMDICFDLLDLRRARAWTDATERWCDQHSNAAMFTGICRVHRAQLLHLSGDWEAAERHVALTCEELADMNVGVVAEGHYRIGEARRVRADHDGADAAFRRAHELGRDPQPGLALLRLAQGDERGASAALRSALAAVDRELQRVPLLVAQVEVAAACGEADVAAEATDELATIADRFATPGLEASALQCDGVSRLAQGRPDAAVGSLHRAVRLWNDLDARHDSARTRVRLAEALAATGDGDTADRELATARLVLTELGAAADLRAIDDADRDRTRSDAAHDTGDDTPGGLTSRELEVLRCVCSGRTNRQIAVELAISEKTVARHLSNIFVKLDVSSRTEAAAFAFANGVADAR